MANLAELEAKFKQADEQLKEAEAFIKDYQTFIETFVQKEKVLSQLSAFYHSGKWVDECETIHNESDKQFNSAGEDSIWDVTSAFYELNIKMLKQISDRLNSDFTE